MRALRIVLLGVITSLLLCGTALATQKGLGSMKGWAQPNAQSTKGELKAIKTVQKGIQYIIETKGKMSSANWHTLQTRAGTINRWAEACWRVKPVWRNGNPVGGTIQLESVVGQGRKTPVTVELTESKGWKVSLDNGLGTKTVATVPAPTGTLRSQKTAPKPLDLL